MSEQQIEQEAVRIAVGDRVEVWATLHPQTQEMYRRQARENVENDS